MKLLRITGRIDARSYPSCLGHFQLAGREVSIYGYMTASAPKHVVLNGSFTSSAGPYMSQILTEDDENPAGPAVKLPGRRTVQPR
jgi:hypothetical protein